MTEKQKAFEKWVHREIQDGWSEFHKQWPAHAEDAFKAGWSAAMRAKRKDELVWQKRRIPIYRITEEEQDEVGRREPPQRKGKKGKR